MEISTVRQMKDRLEDSIRESILLFQKETGLLVTEIRLTQAPMYTGYNEGFGTIYVQAEVKL